MTQKKKLYFICSLSSFITFFVFVDKVKSLSSVKSIFLLINIFEKIILIEIKKTKAITIFILIDF